MGGIPVKRAAAGKMPVRRPTAGKGGCKKMNCETVALQWGSFH